VGSGEAVNRGRVSKKGQGAENRDLKDTKDIKDEKLPRTRKLVLYVFDVLVVL
jgi:hypothetical protein